MIITLKTLLQQTFTVDVDENLTIKDLKRRVQEERGADFPAESLNLIYSGAIMKDEEQIKDYKIDSKKFIVVMKKKEKVEAAPAPQETPKPTTSTTSPASTPADSSSSTPAKKEEPKKPEESVGSSDAAQSSADNEEVIRNMMELGYPRRLVEAALRLSYNNPNVACEYLINERITEANMDSLEADGLSLGAARDDLMDLVEAFDSSRGQAAVNPENEPLAFLRAQPQFHHMRQQIQENPQFLNTVLQQIGVNNPGLLKLISENQTAFVNMINEPLNNNNNTNNNRNVASAQEPAAAAAAAGAVAAPPAAAEQMEGVQEARQFDLTANDDLLAATLAQQIAGEDDDDDGETGGQEPQQQAQGGEPEASILAGLPQLTEEDRAAIRRIQEVSGFSEIEVIQAYIACGKNEDMAANLLFSE